MVKRLILIMLAGCFGLQAVPTTCDKVKSALINGAWFIIKPFDTISDEGVTYFTPHGREQKSMAGMQNEIIENWDSLSYNKYSSADYVKFNLDNNYYPKVQTENEKKKAKNFLAYRANRLKKINEGVIASFSIREQPPKKNHIGLYWYGTGCELKRAAIKFAHYKPYTYLASCLKWIALAAVTGAAVEEGIELVKKMRSRRQKARDDKSLVEGSQTAQSAPEVLK